jgi:signal transduction histidine kinase
MPGAKIRSVSRGFRRTAVLRGGYAAVILVLVLCAVEAYRIQASLSRQHLQIYRHFVEQDNAIATLRRNLWLAGNHIRDFFIHTTPEQAAILRSELKALEAEDEAALEQLGRTASRSELPKLRASLNEFWRIADGVADTMLLANNEKQFEFLQREIVPRRGELYTALIGLTEADQRKLQGSESEFADTRRFAAERLMLMLGIGVLLSFVVVRLSLRYAGNLEAQAERHTREVEQARHELQQLSARLLEVEEEDRRRLSRELHDEIGQTLALLQIEISHAQTTLPAQPAVARERLDRARELAERTVQTIRNISVLLRPALLDDLGLVPAMQFQLEDFLRRSGIACEFVEESVPEQLPDSLKTCVFRVVQEALHNCEKHSGATKVRVALRQVADSIVAEVEDNGRGFQLNDQRMPSMTKGLGLLGMRERIAIAGGSLIVDAAPGHGTRIAVRIPIAAPAAHGQKVTKEVTA